MLVTPLGERLVELPKGNIMITIANTLPSNQTYILCLVDDKTKKHKKSLRLILKDGPDLETRMRHEERLLIWVSEQPLKTF